MIGRVRTFLGRFNLTIGPARNAFLAASLALTGGVVTAKMAGPQGGAHGHPARLDEQSDRHPDNHFDDHHHHTDHHNESEAEMMIKKFGYSAHRPIHGEFSNRVTDPHILKEDPSMMQRYRTDCTFWAIALMPMVYYGSKALLKAVGLNRISPKTQQRAPLALALTFTALYVANVESYITDMKLEPSMNTVLIKSGLIFPTFNRYNIADIKTIERSDGTIYGISAPNNMAKFSSDKFRFMPMKEYKGVAYTHLPLLKAIQSGDVSSVSRYSYDAHN